MVVVQVINSLIGGGAERVTVALAKAFSKLGHISIIVVLTKGGAFEDHEELKIVYASKEHAWKSVEALNPDLILAQMKTPQRLFKDIFDDRLFFVVHNTQSQRLKKNLLSKYLLYNSRVKRLRALYKEHQIVTVSKGVEDDLLEVIGIQPKSIQTIYNPFDIEEIQKEALGEITFAKPYIINVAGLREAKRQDILLKSYAQSGVDMDLVILGQGKLENALKSLAKKLNIQERVHFLGWQDNPYIWIKNAKLFVLSSQFEGFGNVLAEALILNTPVVSTDCPSGPNEILIDDLKKYLVKVNDIDDLSEKITLALQNQITIDPVLYERFRDTEIAKAYITLVE